MDLTSEQIKLMLFLARNRLRYESRRPSRPKPGGTDVQQLKVWELSELVNALEEIQLGK